MRLLLPSLARVALLLGLTRPRAGTLPAWERARAVAAAEHAEGLRLERERLDAANARWVRIRDEALGEEE